MVAPRLVRAGIFLATIYLYTIQMGVGPLLKILRILISDRRTTSGLGTLNGSSTLTAVVASLSSHNTMAAMPVEQAARVELSELLIGIHQMFPFGTGTAKIQDQLPHRQLCRLGTLASEKGKFSSSMTSVFKTIAFSLLTV